MVGFGFSRVKTGRGWYKVVGFVLGWVGLVGFSLNKVGGGKGWLASV